MFSHRRSAPAALLLALVGALVLGACGSDADSDAAADETAAEDTTTTAAAPAEVDIVHAQGTTTVDVDPETVVVFDLGALVTMDEIGAEADAVPTVATLPESLPEYAGDDIPKVGTLFEPDYEAVSALEPT